MITIPIRLNPTKLLQTANCCGLAENLAHARVIVVALAILAHGREVPLVLVPLTINESEGWNILGRSGDEVASFSDVET